MSQPVNDFTDSSGRDKIPGSEMRTPAWHSRWHEHQRISASSPCPESHRDTQHGPGGCRHTGSVLQLSHTQLGKSAASVAAVSKPAVCPEETRSLTRQAAQTPLRDGSGEGATGARQSCRTQQGGRGCGRPEEGRLSQQGHDCFVCQHVSIFFIKDNCRKFTFFNLYWLGRIGKDRRSVVFFEGGADRSSRASHRVGGSPCHLRGDFYALRRSCHVSCQDSGVTLNRSFPDS